MIGAVLVGFGASAHAAFRRDPLPDRIAMGRFALFELTLNVVGLGLIFKTVASTPMSAARRAGGILLCLALGFAAMMALVDSLPP